MLPSASPSACRSRKEHGDGPRIPPCQEKIAKVIPPRQLRLQHVRPKCLGWIQRSGDEHTQGIERLWKSEKCAIKDNAGLLTRYSIPTCPNSCGDNHITMTPICSSKIYSLTSATFENTSSFGELVQMRQYEDQEEVRTKDWEEALSIIENIFRDYKENGSTNESVAKVDPLAVDVARWKVVWGKKPAQYRLKPFLMWSVDEMPSIPEECETFPENVDFVREQVETQRIKNDKKLRLMRKKVFKMNRRVDEINVLLAHAAEEVKNFTGHEDGNGAGGILTESTRAELIVEKNVILDKLRKTKKKLVALRNTMVDKKKIALLGQDDSKDIILSDASGDNRNGLSLNFDQEADGDTLNFKHGRRAAIKKEIRGNVWAKVVNSPLKENSSRSEPSDFEDKKCRKKKFCRKHHRKVQDKSSENDIMLGRRALSETDFARVAKEFNERDQQTLEISESDQKAGKRLSGIGESRNEGMGSGAAGSCRDTRVWQKFNLHQTDLAAGLIKQQRFKKGDHGAANEKSDKDNLTYTSQSNLPKNKRDRNLKITPDGLGDTVDMKRSFEAGKLPKVRKCPPSAAKEVRPKPQMRSKSVNKELTTKVRSTKIAEAAVKIES